MLETVKPKVTLPMSADGDPTAQIMLMLMQLEFCPSAGCILHSISRMQLGIQVSGPPATSNTRTISNKRHQLHLSISNTQGQDLCFVLLCLSVKGSDQVNKQERIPQGSVSCSVLYLTILPKFAAFAHDLKVGPQAGGDIACEPVQASIGDEEVLGEGHPVRSASPI